MYEEDETLDDFATWLDRVARARASGRLSVDDAINAYLDHAGLVVSYHEALGQMSSRFEARRDEMSGELLFYAVIYV